MEIIIGISNDSNDWYRICELYQGEVEHWSPSAVRTLHLGRTMTPVWNSRKQSFPPRLECVEYRVHLGRMSPIRQHIALADIWRYVHGLILHLLAGAISNNVFQCLPVLEHHPMLPLVESLLEVGTGTWNLSTNPPVVSRINEYITNQYQSSRRSFHVFQIFGELWNMKFNVGNDFFHAFMIHCTDKKRVWDERSPNW